MVKHITVTHAAKSFSEAGYTLTQLQKLATFNLYKYSAISQTSGEKPVKLIFRAHKPPMNKLKFRHCLTVK
jgi:hypothetical protein